MQIAVASWSLHREIPQSTPLIEFPRICQEEFGVKVLELNSPFFASTEKGYLDQLGETISKRGMTVVNIAVDLGDIANPDDEERRKDIEALKEWFSIAKGLGSPFIRINAGKGESIDDVVLRRVIDSYKELVEEGEKVGVGLVIENHGGPSANPDNIVRIIETVGSAHFGACPDFGNFAPEIRYQGIARIAKYAFLAHVKSYDFNEEGKETTIDVERCLNILKKAGFEGDLSVEFEGKGNQREGVKKTLALLKKLVNGESVAPC